MISSRLSTTKKGKEGNLGLLLSKSLCIKEEIADEKDNTWRFRVCEVEWGCRGFPDIVSIFWQLKIPCPSLLLCAYANT